MKDYKVNENIMNNIKAILKGLITAKQSIFSCSELISVNNSIHSCKPIVIEDEANVKSVPEYKPNRGGITTKGVATKKKNEKKVIK